MTNVPMTDAGEWPFQKRVLNWLMECFSMEVCRDGVERNHRFLEEALELVQSLGCTRSEAHQLVDYVFGRPIGDPMQELGGVQGHDIRRWREAGGSTALLIGIASRSMLEPLRGKNLACWCALGAPCHADVLLEMANAEQLINSHRPGVPDHG